VKSYLLKVSIIGIPRVNRVLEVSENSTFADLHEAIFEAFDRYDPHLYAFFLTGKDTRNIRAIYRAPEIAHPQAMEDPLGFGRPKKSAERTRLSAAGLAEKGVFHYLFDFGDDWWHRIRVQAVSETPAKRKYIRLVKSVGPSPPQYPEDEDWEDQEEDEDGGDR
jgi:hypothetical protein